MVGMHRKSLIALLGIVASAGAWAQEPAPQMKQAAVVDFKSCAKPQYPVEELAARHQGAVMILFKIGADGKVVTSKIDTSSGFPALDEAARSSLADCRFQPALAADGKPATSWLPVKYVWTLN